ncbi:cell cycle and apoptosis regulator protein 2 isoform X1 [Grus americana]|uniref:cell cycle and apoptosis regulator protein 2 isoform X1 n=1 Tax=Grus americana TaxID=9117 RepID=UPI002407C776|nr:cell cycle and apoptosis regulator protein 2 isoform X1 [Grus americana]
MSPPGRGCIAGGRKTVVTSLQERLGGWMSSSSSSGPGTAGGEDAGESCLQPWALSDQPCIPQPLPRPRHSSHPCHPWAAAEHPWSPAPVPALPHPAAPSPERCLGFLEQTHSWVVPRGLRILVAPPPPAVNLFPSPPSAQLRCPGQGQEQERLGQMSQGSQLCVPTPRARGPLAGEPTQGEPHRPRGSSLPPAPSAMPGRCYGSIRLPHGFYHLCLRWLAPSPPHPPPHWQYPSHIPGADREEDAEATLDDADSAFRFVLYRRLQ